MSPRALAEETKPIAQAWVDSALAGLSKNDALLRAALETCFAWHQVKNEAAHLAHIEKTLREIRKVIAMSSHYFAEVTFARAKEIFAPAGVPPAYSILGDRIYFTPEFERFGPMCRAAMIVHEAVHIFDRISGEPEIHISEWNELFETRTPEQQLHNPSAYAAFTAQIHERRTHYPREERYGAGNPSL